MRPKLIDMVTLTVCLLAIAGGLWWKESIAAAAPRLEASGVSKGASNVDAAETPVMKGATPDLNALFGVRIESIAQAAPPKTTAPTPEKKNAPPRRISFVGAVVEGDGVAALYFRDEDAGRVVVIRNGKSGNGWRLVSQDGAEYVLNIDGFEYRVRKR